jgi:hypothetical protein
VNERETLVAAIGGLHPRHLDAAFASPHIARRTRLSSSLRSVKLAPAVRTVRVDHDFARGPASQTECRSSISGRFLGYPDIWLFRELVWLEPRAVRSAGALRMYPTAAIDTLFNRIARREALPAGPVTSTRHCIP